MNNTNFVILCFFVFKICQLISYDRKSKTQTLIYFGSIDLHYVLRVNKTPPKNQMTDGAIWFLG
ncbi:hypothetical protein AO373_1236 [Moraxella catarrhalis]|nr:hypothetical protein AO379_1743 [Moraxella catarrhalis]OAV17999.1 hypothetical protein AO373_1236 [Moraxella catarrhalis]